MYEKTLIINNKTGLHARPASDLVQFCKQFDSEIMIYAGDNEINAKSIISVLAGGVMQGDEIILRATGPDDEKAGEAVAEFIANLAE